MKKIKLPLFCTLILLLPLLESGAHDVSALQRHPPSSFPGLLPVAQKRALEQRADQVIEANDALIQKTIQANGGNYFHQGKSKILIFNHKIYKDFTIRVVSGNRLIIETEDGAFQMDVRHPEN